MNEEHMTEEQLNKETRLDRKMRLRQIREIVVQYLFQVDVRNLRGVNEKDLQVFFQSVCDNEDIRVPLTHEMQGLAATAIRGVTKHRVTIDEEIDGQMKNWSITRLPKVDKAVLRLAFFELLFCKDIPHIVIINEAVEIGKRFGSDDSSSFLNGVLDSAAKRIRRNE